MLEQPVPGRPSLLCTTIHADHAPTTAVSHSFFARALGNFRSRPAAQGHDKWRSGTNANKATRPEVNLATQADLRAAPAPCLDRFTSVS